MSDESDLDLGKNLSSQMSSSTYYTQLVQGIYEDDETLVL